MASIASPRIPVSGASTPTASSRRTSLDTTRTSSPIRSSNLQLNAPTGTTARRNRAALRDYYNLRPLPATSPAQASSIGDTSSVASTEATNDDDDDNDGVKGMSTSASALSELDKPGFDAEAYVRELLATSGLAKILKSESNLLDEMRELDGERKALVYDNYAKLIAATDTIRGLRKDISGQGQYGASGRAAVPNIDGYTGFGVIGSTGHGSSGAFIETGELKEMVDTIARVATELAGTAGPEKTEVREKIDDKRKEVVKSREEKDRVSRQIQTVKWIVESPQRFKAYIEKDDAEKARQEWLDDVERILDKWKIQGVKGTEDIRLKCLEVIQSYEDGETAMSIQKGEEDADKQAL